MLASPLRTDRWFKLPPAEHVRGELRVARARGMLMAVAAVIGIFAGIATGLFAHAIRFVQIVRFRGGEVASALFGSEHAAWFARFRDGLLHAHWHLEFLLLALLGMAFVLGVEALRPRLPARYSQVEVQRVRAIVLAGSFGLVLYYPLLLLSTFNASFQAPGSSLLAYVLAAPTWLRVSSPMVGAALAALLVRYVSPESGGHGVVEVIEAVHGRKELRGRVAVWKSLAAGLVIGSGGSAGREGPVVHLGGAVASRLCRVLGLSRRDATLLLACGAGAGIAASFNAPLAGAMFALEIVLGDFGAHRFAPIVLACVTATATSHALLGDLTELAPIHWQLQHGWEIAAFLVLGICAGGVGVIYVRALHGAEEVFKGALRADGSSRLGAVGRTLAKMNAPARAALGGLGVGLIGLAVPRVLGTGVESMNAALGGQLALSALLLALLFKLLATVCTLGSGSPGGSFFPAVFLGAMLGGAFSHGIDLLAPGSGAAAAPLTGAMMVFELTASSQIILPLLVACGAAAAVVQWRLGASMYALGARRRGVRLPSNGFTLAELDVAQALDAAPPVAASLSRAQLLELVAHDRHAAHPVVDESGIAMGLLVQRELRRALLDPALPASATALDLMRKGEPVCTLDDDLDEALQRLSSAGVSEALVIDRETRKPLGVITREAILDTWRRSAGAPARPVAHEPA